MIEVVYKTPSNYSGGYATEQFDANHHDESYSFLTLYKRETGIDKPVAMFRSKSIIKMEYK